ncbi:hypothetical protein KUTeg_005287 [Tegillarca granosa]|uniref:M-phase inducer phosphatase n=1 Tax=Tegillarca granosa TaxID=220873 RepID=A0ABQ9FNV2_TEGGR|nr:hypothetical protein KUTeg_005287 [Tegillarca granosa]
MLKMKLFSDIDASPVISKMSLFSPEKSVCIDFEDFELLMTPVGKEMSIDPMIMDEDSGLGMDMLDIDSSILDESEETENNFQIKRPIISKNFENRKTTSKRLLTDDEESPISTSKYRCSRSPIKRSMSYHCGVIEQNSKLSKTLMTKLLKCFQDQLNKGDNKESGVKSVVERFVGDDDLIADGTSSYCLPTIKGKHNDLKSITTETMADVLSGVYDDVVGSFRIIDCRYPYEYDGGHIKGAENLYTHDNILKLLDERKEVNTDGKKEIIIFHCEFSSERGPKMSRFLRSKDRELNALNYPALSYPEVYLLHDGYKSFYYKQKELCEPMSYIPMLHEDHGADLRHFRVKSKSFACGEKNRRIRRRSLVN